MPATTQNGAGIVRFTPGYNRRPEARCYLGLDLGQRHDHSALAVLKLAWTPLGQCPVTFALRFRPELVIRSIERFPLGTSYDDLPAIVKARLSAVDNSGKELVIDAGGPGAPVVDRLRRNAPPELSIRPILITGGANVNTLSGGYTGIPRRTLVSTLLSAINANSISYPRNTPGRKEFTAELLELRRSTSHPAAAEAHDDLVLSVALAVSSAVRDTPQLLPATTGEIRASGYVNPSLF